MSVGLVLPSAWRFNAGRRLLRSVRSPTQETVDFLVLAIVRDPQQSKAFADELRARAREIEKIDSLRSGEGLAWRREDDGPVETSA
jgi:hypothetical protein